MISAKIVADSLSPYGHRLTTFVLVMPRIILAEFNTHRMISRNSASSRAIPFEKMVEVVKTNPFIPINWMKEHKGMQGNEFFEGPAWLDLRETWLIARDNAVREAEYLSSKGVTKQMCNRLLEPFMWHTVVCTGSEWENFFALRAEDGAEIHMQDLAYKMLEVYNSSTPQQLQSGEWHIPFGDELSEKDMYDIVSHNGSLMYFTRPIAEINRTKVKIATARAARISYTTINDSFERKYEDDIKLHDRMVRLAHWSPFEHCAQVMWPGEYHQWKQTVKVHGGSSTDQIGWCKNFRGFIQYRAMFEGENKNDPRVKRDYARNSQPGPV